MDDELPSDDPLVSCRVVHPSGCSVHPLICNCTASSRLACLHTEIVGSTTAMSISEFAFTVSYLLRALDRLQRRHPDIHVVHTVWVGPVFFDTPSRGRPPFGINATPIGCYDPLRSFISVCNKVVPIRTKKKQMGRIFVVLDTESSVCRDTNRRILVSLAYEIVDIDGLGVLEAVYELVQPPQTVLAVDPASESVHGITMRTSLSEGKPVERVIRRLMDCLQRVQPLAVVGHDITGDIKLLVSEALQSGVSPCAFLPLRRLLCTKELSAAFCCLPLPRRLLFDHPCLQTHEHAETTPRCRYKWPSLQESYDILVTHKTPVKGLHDARGDVERCRAVLLHLQRHLLRPDQLQKCNDTDRAHPPGWCILLGKNVMRMA